MTVGGSSGPSQTIKSKSKSSTADIPSARMKPGLAISKGTIYLYGGEYENGSKQYTLNDFYSLGEFFFLHVYEDFVVVFCVRKIFLRIFLIYVEMFSIEYQK